MGMWVPDTNDMTRPQVAERENVQLWRLAANMLKSSYGQPIRGGPPAWSWLKGLTTPPRKKETFTKPLDNYIMLNYMHYILHQT